MNKAYILFPLIGLLAFGGYYLKFNKQYTADQVALVKIAEQKRVDRLRKEQEDRVAAIKIANEQNEQRKKLREEKALKEAAERQAREEIQDRRSRLFDDVTKRLGPQVDRLKKEVAQVKEEIAKLEIEKRNRGDEVSFLRDYVQKAEANARTYLEVLEKLDAAEKARAEAARVAAAAAAKARG